MQRNSLARTTTNTGRCCLGEIDGINSVVSTWIGQKISLMVNTLEKDVLRAKLQLPFEHEMEEVE